MPGGKSDHWLLFEAFAVLCQFGHMAKSHNHLLSSTGNLAHTCCRLVTRVQKKKKKKKGQKKKKRRDLWSLKVNLLEICSDQVSFRDSN